jgi:ATP-dependent helicase/DNAse subunit B
LADSGDLRLDPAATAEQATGFRRSISATAFKDYLSDPANFWLKHALGMRETSHDDLELDRAGFGTLLHAALEQFGRDESMREVSDPARIGDPAVRMPGPALLPDVQRLP